MKELWFALSCFFGKCAGLFSRLLTNGSGEQIQGRVIIALCPYALSIASKAKKIIVVSATNGKTTTTRLITQTLSAKYPNVISNALGANQKAGVIAALVNGNTKQKGQYAVLEIDERSLPGIVKDLLPEVFVLGNLSRDQLDRFGEVSSISNSWATMFEGTSSTIIANGCDPHIVRATQTVNQDQVIYVEIASDWHDDANTCPKCGDLLEWDKNSHFISKSCRFSTPKELFKPSFDLENLINDSLNIPGDWNRKNALLAYRTCIYLGLEDDDIFSAFKLVHEISGRNAIYNIDDDRTIQLFLAKNPAGWNETLKHLSGSDSATIFAFNCNIADGKDPSWLYDVDFENANIGDVIVFGQRATDMQVRLEVAQKNVSVVDNLQQAITRTAFAKHANLVASYTQFFQLSKELPKLLNSKELLS